MADKVKESSKFIDLIQELMLSSISEMKVKQMFLGTVQPLQSRHQYRIPLKPYTLNIYWKLNNSILKSDEVWLYIYVCMYVCIYVYVYVYVYV